MRANPQFRQALAQIEQALGVRLEQLLPLFKNETVFYVRPSVGIPEFSLALQPDNQQQAMATLDRLATRVARLAHARLTTGSEGGVQVKTLSLGRVAVRYGAFDGTILVTSGATGMADFRAAGDKLTDDPVYKDAQSAAGLPDKVGALLYVNIRGSVELARNLAGTAGENLPPDAMANLRPLRSFVAYGTSSDKKAKFSAFLQIK
jgi:hypothetical protein